jgi:hypothetical protein
VTVEFTERALTGVETALKEHPDRSVPAPIVLDLLADNFRLRRENRELKSFVRHAFEQRDQLRAA